MTISTLDNSQLPQMVSMCYIVSNLSSQKMNTWQVHFRILCQNTQNHQWIVHVWKWNFDHFYSQSISLSLSPWVTIWDTWDIQSSGLSGHDSLILCMYKWTLVMHYCSGPWSLGCDLSLTCLTVGKSLRGKWNFSQLGSWVCGILGWNELV